MAGSGAVGWVVVSVSTAGAPASLRVLVWRRLRSWGALYLQQSVCMLPAQPRVLTDLARLVNRVAEQGGTARVVAVQVTDPVAEAGLIDELNAARDAEYTELLERLPAFHTELEQETARGRATYAEVEESEADLHRYQAWLGKITARDYFHAPAAATARAAVQTAETALARFERAALTAENPAGIDDTTTVRTRDTVARLALRVVEGP